MSAIRFTMLLMVLGLLGTATDSLAQAPDEVTTGMWAGVEKVPPGEKLLVKLKDGKKLKGRLVSTSDTGLTLSRKNKTMDLDRERVQQIFRLMPKSARKATLIGVGVGLAIAAAATAGVCEGESGTGCAAWGMLIFGGSGAGLGALAGWRIGSGKERVLIYDAQVLKTILRPSEAGKRVPRYDLLSRNQKNGE